MKEPEEEKTPWSGVCCQPCWYAKKKRCTCKCGGKYHGQGLPKESIEGMVQDDA